MENLSKLKAITILWHEGTNEFKNTLFTAWADVQPSFDKIYKDHMKDGGAGYCKVKVCLEWQNGHMFSARVDVGASKGDYCPDRETVANYLKRSGYENTEALSFSDNDSQPKNSPKNSHKQPKTARKQPASQPASQPKNSPKTGLKTGKIRPKIAGNVPTYQPAPETPKNSPKIAKKQPYFNLCFRSIIEMQAETYLLN